MVGAMIGPRTAIGARPHRVTLDGPGTPVPDADGGYTETPAPLNPAAVFASIVPVSDRDLERASSGTVTAMATHRVTMPYHPQVTTRTTLHYEQRTFNVQSVANVEERDVELVLLCVEVAP